MQVFDEGNEIRVTATFTNKLNMNTPVDPIAVLAIIRDPLGVETQYEYGVDAELVKDDVGVYHVMWVLNVPGVHSVRFWSEGSAIGSEEAQVMAQDAVTRV